MDLRSEFGAICKGVCSRDPGIFFILSGTASSMRLPRKARSALAGEQGRAELRNTQEVSGLLADHPALRLVVLNACEGAQTGTQALYASIAEHLVRPGAGRASHAVCHHRQRRPSS